MARFDPYIRVLILVSLFPVRRESERDSCSWRSTRLSVIDIARMIGSLPLRNATQGTGQQIEIPEISILGAIFYHLHVYCISRWRYATCQTRIAARRPQHIAGLPIAQLSCGWHPSGRSPEAGSLSRLWVGHLTIPRERTMLIRRYMVLENSLDADTGYCSGI